MLSITVKNTFALTAKVLKYGLYVKDFWERVGRVKARDVQEGEWKGRQGPSADKTDETGL